MKSDKLHISLIAEDPGCASQVDETLPGFTPSTLGSRTAYLTFLSPGSLVPSTEWLQPQFDR